MVNLFRIPETCGYKLHVSGLAPVTSHQSPVTNHQSRTQCTLKSRLATDLAITFS